MRWQGRKMNSSIFDQLFKIKYGNRSKGYDVENAIPGWDENFDNLLDDLTARKKLFQMVYSLYGHSQNQTIDVQVNLGHVIPVFEEISNLRFKEELESIIAQETLMVIYGIKISINLLPLVKTEDDVSKFYKFYCILHGIVLGIQETYKNDKRDFWHQYAFKLGLHFLALAMKAKELGENDFFEVSKDYGIYFKNLGGRGTNPLSFILPSITNYGYGLHDRNDFYYDILTKEVTTIIEKGMPKNV